jgi:hypothetical protein
MISLDFLQFDQTNLWFFALSAIGLARSRKLLPFVIVVIANLIHGTFLLLELPPIPTKVFLCV